MKQMTKTIAVIAAITSVFAATSAQAAYRTVYLTSFGSRVFTYEADRGELFRVEISGDGRTDVDLTVKNAAGSTVCARTGTTDDEVCTVRASRSGEYTIELDNMGASSNRVQLWLD
jgi:hypothetical protein